MSFDPARLQLFVVDFQEKLFGAMPEGPREAAAKAAGNLRFAFDALSLPVVTTEQYPQGLGPTLEPLRGAPTFAKTTFSAMRDEAIAAELRRPAVVLAGMETHICVTLTALDLRARGVDVIVVPDACVSRRKADWRAGLALMEGAGARIVPSETLLFALVERAGTPLFKEISRRIR
ncbi:MAG: isochorismatase family protein [Myxococcota bacterium]